MKRYDIGSRWTDTPVSGDREVPCMVESENGEFVKASDYDDLKARVDKLKKYFTSTNKIPIERATILARDFWSIFNVEPFVCNNSDE